MAVFRPLLFLLLLSPLAALAEGDCEDNFFECKDDCLIEFGGSIRVQMKKKYGKCMKKCTKVANRCTERVMETTASHLDEGALDGTPASDEERTGSKPRAKKKVAAEAPVADSPSDDEPVRKKEALTDSELPTSDRTTLKTDEVPAASQKSKEKEAPLLEPERAEAPKKEVIEMKMTPKQEEEPPPPPPKKKVEKKEEPPKKKEEDHDDLRFY